MGRRSNFTREAILAAADQIEAEGGTATMAAVRSRLGGGSFTTITAAMSARKPFAQAPAGKQVYGPGLPVRPATLSVRMDAFGEEIWAAALREAHAHYTEKIAQLEAELSAAQDKLQALRSALQV